MLSRLLHDAASGVAETETAPPEISRSAMSAELTIVVPTFNERDNVELLIARLDAALRGIEWEVLYVDDDFSRRHSR